MTDLILPRRRFLTGLLGGMVAASCGPAIVRASSLMAIKPLGRHRSGWQLVEFPHDWRAHMGHDGEMTFKIIWATTETRKTPKIVWSELSNSLDWSLP